MKEVNHYPGGKRKKSQVSADGIVIERREGFKKSGYNNRTPITKNEDTEIVGDLEKIGGNERYPVGTKKGIVMGSFQSDQQRDSGHQTTIEDRKGRDMEDNYCQENNIPQ